jgi:hypothetical protein
MPSCSNVLDEVAARPPRLVLFRPDDKYNNDATRRVMDLVRTRYERIETIDGLRSIACAKRRPATAPT